MKKRLILAALVISGLLLSLTGGLASAQPSDNAQGHVPDQILVKFLPGTPEKMKADVHQRHGGKLEGVIPGIDVQVVKIPENKVKDEVKAYKGEASVEFVEPDYIAKAIFTPDDPYFGNQWGMTQIQAPDAWNITQGASEVRIAICDTGIDQNHEDLAAKIVANRNFTRSRTVDDKYGHGTHVAGIAAAITNNGKGVAGVGFNSSLMNVKVLGDDGIGNYSWVANGITWAADNGAKVINLSLGGTSPSSTLEDAVNYAWDQGCVIVAAAGNDNTSTPLYPAYYTNCIAVAATDRSDAKASWSNFGTWVDIAAPGVDIFSTTPNHSFYLQNYGYKLNYDYMSGTSMATPHVAGLAGLVWATEYGTDNAAVRDRIEGTADQAGTMWSTYGIKRVNAYNAVAPAGPPPPDTTGPVTSGVAASPNPTAGAASVTLTATISDVSTGGSDIAGAEYFIDTIGANGSGTLMSASDGAFDSPTEGVTATIDVSGLSVGDYTLYVHGQDANGYWGGTSSTQLNITEAPTGNVNDMYVWSIDFRTIGTPWRISRLYIDITIKHDSNANGIAEATDGAVANATVNIIVTNQTTGQTWTGTGAITGSNGVATYYLNNPPKGSYVVEVIKLTHATYIWNKALDKENPSSPYTLSRGSGWSTRETLKFLER
jgi:thermitase